MIRRSSKWISGKTFFRKVHTRIQWKPQLWCQISSDYSEPNQVAKVHCQGHLASQATWIGILLRLSVDSTSAPGPSRAESKTTVRQSDSPLCQSPAACAQFLELLHLPKLEYLLHLLGESSSKKNFHIRHKVRRYCMVQYEFVLKQLEQVFVFLCVKQQTAPYHACSQKHLTSGFAPRGGCSMQGCHLFLEQRMKERMMA